jgi:hypothetical protein
VREVGALVGVDRVLDLPRSEQPGSRLGDDNGGDGRRPDPEPPSAPGR